MRRYNYRSTSCKLGSDQPNLDNVYLMEEPIPSIGPYFARVVPISTLFNVCSPPNISGLVYLLNDTFATGVCSLGVCREFVSSNCRYCGTACTWVVATGKWNDNGCWRDGSHWNE